jgi:ketopantoate reductase
MRVAIYGPGGAGGYFGAQLAGRHGGTFKLRAPAQTGFQPLFITTVTESESLPK